MSLLRKQMNLWSTCSALHLRSSHSPGAPSMPGGPGTPLGPREPGGPGKPIGPEGPTSESPASPLRPAEPGSPGEPGVHTVTHTVTHTNNKHTHTHTLIMTLQTSHQQISVFTFILKIFSFNQPGPGEFCSQCPYLNRGTRLQSLFALMGAIWLWFMVSGYL